MSTMSTTVRRPAEGGGREGFHCGAIALVGRPNVGKSTLLNALLGQKLSITSRKPQTTRHRIRGVLTKPDAQYIFVDTPGYQTRHKSALNRLMNRDVSGALAEVDAVLFVVEAGRFDAEDAALLKLLPAGRPVLLVVSKTDRADPAGLLPFLRETAARREFAEVVPVSARRGKGLAELLRALRAHLPEQPAIYAEDEITDRSERFLAAELLREKVFRSLGDEVPYGVSVEIEKFEATPKLRRIHAAIVVDKEGHKGIVIGAKGEQMKRIATAARLDMEKLFGGKVHLEVWVKVRSGWTDNEAALRRLGYGGND
jgi:GTP-binding protein Era